MGETTQDEARRRTKGPAAARETAAIFSEVSIPKLRAGTKTQTRRTKGLKAINLNPSAARLLSFRDGVATFGHAIPDDPVPVVVRSSYRPGETVWVRETWGYRGASWSNQKPGQHEVRIAYRADDSKREFIRKGEGWASGLPKQKPPPEPRNEDDFEAILARDDYYSRWWKSWRSPLFMPRWAARIFLRVEEVRCERLQSISEEDAVAEGVERVGLPGDTRPLWRVGHELHESAVGAFSAVWEALHGPGAWDANPWVFAVTFRTLTGEEVPHGA